jgi:hypothetical protein
MNPFALTTDHLEGYRVFTGADGDSELEPLRIDARYWPMFDTGKKLGIIDLPKAPERGVQIVFGPPDLDLPLHPAPYREMFVMIAGSITLKTAKVSLELGPGSVLLFEDTDARIGHGGRTGPEGYVSVSIAP